MKTYISTISLTLFYIASLMAQKNIHLAHGHAGSIGTWQTLEAKINANCSSVNNVTNKTYVSTEGIIPYRDEFVAEIQSVGANPNDILIGHSFGGLVARSMDADNTTLFGGYITAGTPHHGTKLANSLQDGKLENLVESGCHEVVHDPLAAATSALESSPFTVFFSAVTGVLASASDVLCDNLFQATLTVEGWFGSPWTGTDQATITALRLDGEGQALPASTMPSISLLCDAPSPVHWNLLSEATDSDVTGQIQNVQDEINAMADILRGYSSLFRVKWYNPGTWLFGGLSSGMRNTAFELEEGADWLENSEQGWLEIIGAGTQGSWVNVPHETKVRVQCVTGDDCPVDYKCIDNKCVGIYDDLCDEGPNSDWIWITEIVYVPTYIPGPDKDNDGVVLTESQMLPGALRHVPVQNVTHFGEGKSDEVHSKISEQFNPLTPPANPVFEIQNCDF